MSGAINDTAANIGLASLILQASGTPSIINLVPEVIRGLAFISDVLDFEDDLLSIRNTVMRAHERLATWTVISGWADGQLAPSLQIRRRYIEMTLVEIADHYTKIQKALDSYGGNDASSVSTASVIPDPTQALEREREKQREEKRGLARRNSLMSYKRYLFAGKDREVLESLVEDLSMRINYLVGLLPRRLLTAQEELLQREKLIKLLDLNSSDTASLVKFRNDALVSGDDDLAQTAMQIIRTGLAQTERAVGDYEKNSQAQSGRAYIPFNDMLLPKDSLRDCRPIEHGRELGLLMVDGKSCQVLVENRQFKMNSDGEAEDPRRVIDLQLAVDSFCFLLAAPDEERPKDLRTLRCLGHLIDSRNSFRLVFALPDEAQGMQTLYDYMQLKKFRKFRPSLEDRYRLALIMAKCLSRIHTVGWLHKEFRSSNILFVQCGSSDNTQEPEPSIDNPYVCGFDHARPAQNVDLSHEYNMRDNNEWDLYRHPNCAGGKTLRGSYKRSYDIYSLGVVLTEIGHWAIVNDPAFNRWAPRNGMDRTQFNEALMIQDNSETHYKSPLNALAFRMGAAYRKAVHNCFNLNFDGTDGLVVFRREVIAPLTRAVDAFQEVNSW
jgi:hypothetical protein